MHKQIAMLALMSMGYDDRPMRPKPAPPTAYIDTPKPLSKRAKRRLRGKPTPPAGDRGQG